MAEIENQFGEPTELVQSSGGIFEVEDRNVLIFSKKATNRFPEDDEISKIVTMTDAGLTLNEAQKKAAESAPKSISFAEWLPGFMRRKANN